MIKVLFGIQVIVSVNVINGNCKWREKLVHKLVEEYTENVKEVKLAKITSTELSSAENVCKCSSCRLYIASSSIIFTINAGIGTYYVYYKSLVLKKICYSY